MTLSLGNALLAYFYKQHSTLSEGKLLSFHVHMHVSICACVHTHDNKICRKIVEY